MAIRRELLLILILILVIAVLVKLVEFFQVNVEEADASKFVLEDLKSKYPGADISIMTITPKTNEQGGKYFEVKARVTQFADSPCPERSHIFYNYPAQNFVPAPTEAITRNCKVCTEGICTIAFPEEAVIASHTFPGTEKIQQFLAVNQDALPSVSEQADSWVVTWDSQGIGQFYLVEIHRDGRVLEIKMIAKT
jgi:hypothetical protein